MNKRTQETVDGGNSAPLVDNQSGCWISSIIRHTKGQNCQAESTPQLGHSLESVWIPGSRGGRTTVEPSSLPESTLVLNAAFTSSSAKVFETIGGGNCPLEVHFVMSPKRRFNNAAPFWGPCADREIPAGHPMMRRPFIMIRLVGIRLGFGAPSPRPRPAPAATFGVAVHPTINNFAPNAHDRIDSTVTSSPPTPS